MDLSEACSRPCQHRSLQVNFVQQVFQIYNIDSVFDTLSGVFVSRRDVSLKQVVMFSACAIFAQFFRDFLGYFSTLFYQGLQILHHSNLKGLATFRTCWVYVNNLCLHQQIKLYSLHFIIMQYVHIMVLRLSSIRRYPRRYLDEISSIFLVEFRVCFVFSNLY